MEQYETSEKIYMIDTTSKQSAPLKQRITAFVDPILVKRAKVRGALENLTISEVVEKALDAYAPIIDFDEGKRVKVTFSKKVMTKEALTKSLQQVKNVKKEQSRDLAVDRP